MIKEPILITGCARSGTSMTAGIFNTCGAWGGVMGGANRHNKKGTFENMAIRQSIVKPFLKEIGVDPLGQNPLPDINNLPKADDWRDRILETLVHQGLEDETDWFYKGAKMCLFWPIWHKAFPNAKWIIVRRSVHEIVQSCMKTTFMKAYNTEDGWIHWVNQHIARFIEMWYAGLQIREVWPRKIIDGDLSEIKEAINWCGLPWKEKEVVDFVSPSLWHNKEVNGYTEA